MGDFSRYNDKYVPSKLTETAIENLAKLNDVEPTSTKERIRYMQNALMTGIVLPSCADRARKTISNLKAQL